MSRQKPNKQKHSKKHNRKHAARSAPPDNGSNDAINVYHTFDELMTMTENWDEVNRRGNAGLPVPVETEEDDLITLYEDLMYHQHIRMARFYKEDNCEKENFIRELRSNLSARERAELLTFQNGFTPKERRKFINQFPDTMPEDIETPRMENDNQMVENQPKCPDRTESLSVNEGDSMGQNQNQNQNQTENENDFTFYEEQMYAHYFKVSDYFKNPIQSKKDFIDGFRKQYSAEEYAEFVGSGEHESEQVSKNRFDYINYCSDYVLRPDGYGYDGMENEPNDPNNTENSSIVNGGATGPPYEEHSMDQYLKQAGDQAADNDFTQEEETMYQNHVRISYWYSKKCLSKEEFINGFREQFPASEGDRIEGIQKFESLAMFRKRLEYLDGCAGNILTPQTLSDYFSLQEKWQEIQNRQQDLNNTGNSSEGTTVPPSYNFCSEDFLRRIHSTDPEEFKKWQEGNMSLTNADRKSMQQMLDQLKCRACVEGTHKKGEELCFQQFWSLNRAKMFGGMSQVTGNLDDQIYEDFDMNMPSSSGAVGLVEPIYDVPIPVSKMDEKGNQLSQMSRVPNPVYTRPEEDPVYNALIRERTWLKNQLSQLSSVSNPTHSEPVEDPVYDALIRERTLIKRNCEPIYAVPSPIEPKTATTENNDQTPYTPYVGSIWRIMDMYKNNREEYERRRKMNRDRIKKNVLNKTSVVKDEDLAKPIYDIPIPVSNMDKKGVPVSERKDDKVDNGENSVLNETMVVEDEEPPVPIFKDIPNRITSNRIKTFKHEPIPDIITPIYESTLNFFNEFNGPISSTIVKKAVSSVDKILQDYKAKCPHHKKKSDSTDSCSCESMTILLKKIVGDNTKTIHFDPEVEKVPEEIGKKKLVKSGKPAQSILKKGPFKKK